MPSELGSVNALDQGRERRGAALLGHGRDQGQRGGECSVVGQQDRAKERRKDGGMWLWPWAAVGVRRAAQSGGSSGGGSGGGGVWRRQQRQRWAVIRCERGGRGAWCTWWGLTRCLVGAEIDKTLNMNLATQPRGFAPGPWPGCGVKDTAALCGGWWVRGGGLRAWWAQF